MGSKASMSKAIDHWIEIADEAVTWDKTGIRKKLYGMDTYICKYFMRRFLATLIVHSHYNEILQIGKKF